ncbi:MAG TPA: hydrogenase maturation protease [Bryobacteraceae bacterium]|nr:hydrogenase maturation protease [Bryobacteraceae bacterium]
MTAGSVEPAPVLVLALGNLLLRDDAVGLCLLEMLMSDPAFGPEVDFIDGGTQGLALLPYLDGRRALLVLDAVALGAAPGTVHMVRRGQLEGLRARAAGSAHEGGALELLATARMLGIETSDITIVGIEPAEVSTGIGLSPEVQSALAEALDSARNELRELCGAGLHTGMAAPGK